MTNIRITAAAFVSTLALGAFAAPAAMADDATAPTTDPCATQQAQLDKAEAKLEALQAKFAAAAAKVKAERTDVAEADTAAEKRSEKADLAQAKEKKAHVKKAKKAQVQRVAHAQARLDKCLAANPAPAPAPTA
ncbi:MAG TPA: hypothetical protein VNS81_02650 [Nocardioides sp.]|nr:hypothetical protein [Nocardioides sp.]